MIDSIIAFCMSLKNVPQPKVSSLIKSLPNTLTD